MKNYEKYAEEIKRYSDSQVLCDEIKIPFILEPTGKSCTRDIDCDTCQTLTTLWLLEEYEEPKKPEIDWSKVEVDTPILVRDSENTEWLKKYFAKYEDGLVYVWNLGRTSWTAPNKSVSAWQYAKLIEDEKDPEIDWSKVAVDTPILVRQGKNGTWLERHFAKYENGDVYAWVDGQTSWTGVDEIKWKYAKLAEGEKECEEPKVDWNKVEVDTPILVRYSEKGAWIRRKFAKFEDGVVYAWHGKETGHSKSYMTPWNYAKLAEMEDTE